ncbi:MAG: 3-phosphoshikimate 1-carboxyvinyltransferase [Eubacteriales bacterium]
MKVKIEKSVARGEIYAPPSKSYAHRMLICSSLASGQSTVNNIAKSEDISATLDCIKELGAKCKINGTTAEICGICGNSVANATVKKFMCRESGSTLRFFIPIALSLGGVSEFYGTEKLISRGIEVYEDICKKQNILLEKSENRIRLEGKLKPGVFDVRGDISSQFISGLMFALPILDGDSIINITTPQESKGYILITADVISRFGIRMKFEDNKIYIDGNQKYTPINSFVEGDMSNGAFLDAFNVLGGYVSVKGLNKNTYQPDRVYSEYFEKLKTGTPVLDVSGCPDLAPILIAIAAVCNGATLTGTRRLKIKESDRAQAMACELEKMGGCVDIFENSLTVYKRELHRPEKALCSHNDHRIVMALSVILTLFGGEIEGAEAVDKSYPNFFDDLKTLGVEVSYEI